MVATLRPPHNRVPKSRPGDARGAPWPFASAIAIEERDTAKAARTRGMSWIAGVISGYLGTAASLSDARALYAAADVAPTFEAAMHRILGARIARGLAVTPLDAAAVENAF